MKSDHILSVTLYCLQYFFVHTRIELYITNI